MKNPASWTRILGFSCIAALPLSASATSTSVPPPCFLLISPIVPLPPPGVAPQDIPPPESQSQRVKRILNDVSEKRCVWENLQFDGEAEADLSQLKQIMLADPDPVQRRFAAEAFAAVKGHVKAVLAALSTDFDKEPSADVLHARLSSISTKLEGISLSAWDESIDLASFLANLAYARDGHSTAGAQRVLGEKAYMLARLVANMSSMARSDDGPVKSRASKEWWTVANIELLRSLEQWDASEGWLEPALTAFGDAMAEKVVALDAQQQASLLLALQKTMSAQDDALRASGIRLMSSLAVSQLSSSEAERIYASSLSATHDASPLVRAHSVTLLGEMVRLRGSDGAELLPALDDSSELVRTFAANALQRLQVLPPATVPLLSVMAKREGDEAKAAIEALAFDEESESLQLLAEILTSKAPRTEEEYYGETPIAVAIRALSKHGSKAVMPLLAQAAKASDEDTQGRLYAALVNAGWPGVDVHPAAVEQVLTPAIAGENEEARLFALSMLAMQPHHGEYRYATSLVDDLSERYLREKPKRVSKRGANPRDIPVSGSAAYFYWNETWHMHPALAVGMIAGESDSRIAAELMVNWVCARHRMELAFVGKRYMTYGGSPLNVEIETSKAMGASLQKMGNAAKRYIESALSQKRKTVLCQRYLSVGS